MNLLPDSIIAVDRMNPREDIINKAIDALAGGGLVVAPTDTCYGLLARADSITAVERLVNLKGRKSSQPIALFVHDIAQASRLASFNETSRAIASAFLPGPLTMVLPSLVDWPAPLVVDGKVGIRIPDSVLVHALVSRLKVPLTATSANKSGETGAETVNGLLSTFSAEISLYLDGGPLQSPASTVVEIIDEEVRVIREGALTRSALIDGLKTGRVS